MFGTQRKFEYSHATQRLNALRQAFAQANGWSRPTEVFPFRLLLPREQRPRTRRALYGTEGIDALTPSVYQDNSHTLDHLEGYKVKRRPIAVVSMPYNRGPDPDPAWDARIRAVAARYGLEAHLPPLPLSGWWFPGWTTLIVFMAPGGTVRWLPMNTDADALAREVEAYAEAERQDRVAREAREAWWKAHRQSVHSPGEESA